MRRKTVPSTRTQRKELNLRLAAYQRALLSSVTPVSTKELTTAQVVDSVVTLPAQTLVRRLLMDARLSPDAGNFVLDHLIGSSIKAPAD